MFYKWRINRLKRKIVILKVQLKNLNSLGNCDTYYVDKALRVATKLGGCNYDLGKLEDKS